MSTALAAPPRWRFGAPFAPLVAAVERGAILAVPTESSYGLAVDPRDAAAVAGVFEAKGRAAAEPLPVIAADRAQILALGVDAADPALDWALARWPAALSVVLDLAAPLAATAGEPTVAVRIPAHEGLRRLLAEVGRALTATSANPSGAAPYLEADRVADWLRGRDAIVVDAGTLPGGPPSTLVRWRTGGAVEVLRRGRVEL